MSDLSVSLRSHNKVTTAIGCRTERSARRYNLTVIGGVVTTRNEVAGWVGVINVV